jgi:hypothetical protein
MFFVFSSRCRYFLGYISEEFDNSDRPNSRQRLDEADAVVNAVTESQMIRWIDASGNVISRRYDDISDFGHAIQSRLKNFLNKKLLEQNNGNYLPEDLISAI